ncbi:hypothetical protein [Lutibacter sp. B1]|jgi:hypothetical protein|uniref:hypothetical protein n=1 Tax=Lutibacter sp. B1 TaxID=2725996 RepID=UPI001456F54F|nr:hypothetical protein [Lutibacter sp. B1]NLP59421.1 hypothetical protein [Lutibacter sp. B1]
MKNLIIILVVSLFFSCNETNEMVEQFNYQASIEFSILNSQNEDLLNPENSNHLDETKIKLFYVINGIKQEVNNPNYDYPRGFRIYKHENEYRIGVTLNSNELTEKPITYIQWNDNDIDTIEVVFNRTQNSVLQNMIWLNGTQVWERGNNTIDPYFVLIK